MQALTQGDFDSFQEPKCGQRNFEYSIDIDGLKRGLEIIKDKSLVEKFITITPYDKQDIDKTFTITITASLADYTAFNIQSDS